MQHQWAERRLAEQSQRPNDHRTPWQRDRARILHSAAFRRLQAKTQIMGIGQNDFYRTRLTHSLEAAQIGTALVAQLSYQQEDPALRSLLAQDSLMEALCLAHDLGHPPFGHGGEKALNACMQQFGGFEGNGQTLRIVGKLEPYTASGGMNLSRRTLLGLLKYPIVQPAPGQVEQGLTVKPCKAIYASDSDLLDWILSPLATADREAFQRTETLDKAPFLKSLYKSLDASIMELADDIAYGVHDLEDAIVTGTVSSEHWRRLAEPEMAKLPADIASALKHISQKLFIPEHHIRKDAIGALVNLLITSVELYQSLPQALDPLIRYNARLPEPQQQLLQLLKSFVYEAVILSPEVQRGEYKGQQIVRSLFDAFSSQAERLLPANTKNRWQRADNQQAQMRIICDYVSGMTDEYALRMHQQLFAASL
ncbi:deoxyguanosinetriphosphate triphosphohydrolase family protein [Rheinheimera mesophila]|uniref:Deoxyguanosinetriphosphate triphosphohydrolase-like protein n=1 Tax=Rheinheimera mesophila TaxID=1547515 RepID=A0A3P3QBL7_9GAMM|nr:anti-phage deoxyguanosine triphosphatase [Rheinheimera mesophila]KKL00493.1 deoxyguanosinetriphosphate triphosphohydrolase [Rheinheimera mesophila]RRJ18484.1 deoxyguanosinetriphosphate triphosphohydrolase family protein [Rheinheimera mesophila]